MAQIKKPEVREAILQAAFELFSRKGYTTTTMAQIARTANMTVANLYVYFDSKLLLFYEIYKPWLQEQLLTLQESVNRLRTPRAKLHRIIIGVWRDIPSHDNHFANAMIEALASAPVDTKKPGNVLEHAEKFIYDMMVECLPEEKRVRFNQQLFVHIIWMAFDGFVNNRRINDVRDMNEIAEMMTELLLGPPELAI